MRKLLVALAAGVSCFLFPEGVAVQQAPRETGALPAHVENARVETRAAAPNLEAAFSALARDHASPAWVAYSVRSTPGEHGLCDADAPRRIDLEGRSAADLTARQAVPASDMVVLFRVEGGKIQKLRVASVTCELDAGGLPFVWLTGVGAADSIRYLSGLAKGKGPAGLDVEAIRVESALMAIALHGDPVATRTLQELAAPGEPAALRKRAVFWLGTARGDVETLIRLARSDENLDVRKEAMFWLARSRDARATAFTDEILRKH